ncbi:MAG TPA: creatininase family protein [Planctomycetota bacterium]|nr:creatininase family protein [Planctomycetota bacterium]
MRWEELTAPDFARAVRRTKGLCIVPVGVVEKHGDHLPLGTDYLYASAVAARAAELEPAVVFPPYYFGQIHEARHLPGTVALSSRLIVELLGEVCAEIARNGLKKIVLLNGHGGNRHLVPFVKSALEAERDYAVYLLDLAAYYTTENDPGWQAPGDGDRRPRRRARDQLSAGHPPQAGQDERDFPAAGQPARAGGPPRPGKHRHQLVRRLSRALPGRRPLRLGEEGALPARLPRPERGPAGRSHQARPGRPGAAQGVLREEPETGARPELRFKVQGARFGARAAAKRDSARAP